jgi:hypothetical protein
MLQHFYRPIVYQFKFHLHVVLENYLPAIGVRERFNAVHGGVYWRHLLVPDINPEKLKYFLQHMLTSLTSGHPDPPFMIFSSWRNLSTAHFFNSVRIGSLELMS